MNFPAYVRSLAAKFLHRSEVAEDMQEELRSHIQYRADDLERSGLDAPRQSDRLASSFGARERFKEECHQAMGGHFFETLCRMCGSLFGSCAVPGSPSPPWLH